MANHNRTNWATWPLGLILILLLMLAGESCSELNLDVADQNFLGVSLTLTLSWFFLLRPLNQLKPFVICGTVLFLTISVWQASTFSATPIALGLTGLVLGGFFFLPIVAEKEPTKCSPMLESKLAVPSVSTQSVQPLDVSCELEEDFETKSEGAMVQSWKRYLLPDGSERLEGVLTVQFQRGERLLHCHIPISPAFSSIPEVWCECEEPGFRPDVAMTQSYGVQITLRRSSGECPEIETQVAVVMNADNRRRQVA